MVDPFSEPMLAALLGAMPDGAAFCRLDYQGSVLADCTVLYANPALHQLIGEGELIGKHFDALFDEVATAQQDRLALLTRIVEQAADNAYEHYRQAQEKWYSVSAYRPKAGHAMLVFRDVSSQHQVEGDLLRSEARLRAIIETAPIPLSMVDSQGNVTYLNAAFRNTFGYTLAEISTLADWWPRAYPDPQYRAWVIDTWESRIAKSQSEGTPFEKQEVQVHCKDGSQRTIVADMVPLGMAFAGIHLIVLYDISDQKKAQQALLDAEHYAEWILNSVGDGLCRVDETGVVTYINPVGAGLLGYQPEQMLGKNAHLLFHHSYPDGRIYPEAECKGRFALEKGLPHSVDDEVFWRQDGSSFAVHYVSAPMWVNGQLRGSVLTFRDTSEERAIRKTLLDNEVKIRKAQEMAGFGSYMTDFSTGQWESSAALDAIFGVDASFVHDIPGWNLLLDPEFRAPALKHYEDVVAGKCEFRMDYRITRPSDGQQRWVAANGEIERDKSGQPLRLIGTIQDITERKQIEAELQRNHDLLHKLADEVPGALFQFTMAPDGSFAIPFASRGMVEMFDVTPEEVKADASRVFAAIPEVERKVVIESIVKSARTLENWAEVFPVELKRGRAWLHAQSRPELQADGSITWHGFVNDATERVQSRAQLLTMNETLELRVQQRTQELLLALDSAEMAKTSRGQFLANMSHEIRTPMNTVMGMAHLALKTQPAPQMRHYLEKIQQSSAHLLNIINDILDFSKIDAGKLQLDIGTVALAQTLEHIIQLSEGRAIEKGLRLHLEIQPEVPPFVRGDALRMSQILLNFLNNAIKFTEHGSVVLRVRRLESMAQAQSEATCRLRFEVVDSGIGVDPEQGKRLFKSFEQGDNSTTRKYGGTGLGLAISSQLATLMGGSVGVTGQIGVGSTFWLELRLDVAAQPGEQALTAPRDVDAAIQSLCGKRVLVVDDNDFNLDVARGLLQDAAIEVAVARDGAQAVDALLRSAFDCVLMDVQMPVMDGMEATRRIRSTPELAQLAVIAMTANAGQEDRAKCLAAGMNEVIVKPVDPDDLFLTLARWIGAAGAVPEMPAPSLAAPVAMPTSAAPAALAVGAGEAVPDLSDLVLWDANALARMVGNNPATHARLLDKYRVTAHETVAAMQGATRAGQWVLAADLAHKLKSSSRSVGAMRLGGLCEALERSGRSGDSAACLALAQAVSEAFAEVLTCMPQA